MPFRSRSTIITLLTDFGERDGYAGATKGVIWGICPQARIVDLTHDVEPQNVRAGAFLLSRHCRYFPRRTIHVAVVDPAVGSQRRIVLVLANQQYFLAPDNGLLSFLTDTEGARFYVANNAKYWLPEVSGTFHGRDIFAPLAAHLARGEKIENMFERTDKITKLETLLPENTKTGLAGEIIYVDRFGNLISNIPAEMIRGPHGACRVEFGDADIGPLAHHYAEKPPGEALATIGSFGHVEIAVNFGSAAELYPDYRKRRVVLVFTKG